MSINSITIIENSVQVFFASFFCAWFRRPLAGFWSFFVHFQLLAFLCLAWSILISMTLPPDQVTLAAGFFFSFCGLLISGAFPPVLYADIYADGGFKEILAGWLSPTRYFYEALAVGEYRCMPEQSAFTITDEAVNRPYNTSMIISLYVFLLRLPRLTFGYNKICVRRVCKPKIHFLTSSCLRSYSSFFCFSVHQRICWT